MVTHAEPAEVIVYLRVHESNDGPASRDSVQRRRRDFSSPPESSSTEPTSPPLLKSFIALRWVDIIGFADGRIDGPPTRISGQGQTDGPTP